VEGDDDDDDEGSSDSDDVEGDDDDEGVDDSSDSGEVQEIADIGFYRMMIVIIVNSGMLIFQAKKF